MGKNDLTSARFELATFSVLDWCDNQLHHEAHVGELILFKYKGIPFSPH